MPSSSTLNHQFKMALASRAEIEKSLKKYYGVGR